MFRFTIRELILLTVIVAMGAAWWLSIRRERQLVAELATTNAELVKSRAESKLFERGMKADYRIVAQLMRIEHERVRAAEKEAEASRVLATEAEFHKRNAESYAAQIQEMVKLLNAAYAK